MEGLEVALARELWRLDQEAQRLEMQLRGAKERYDAKASELQKYLADEGKNGTGHIEGVGEFKLRRENYPAVSKARMPLFLTYLRAIGDQNLIEETVHPQTLKKYCKEKIEELTATYIEDEAQFEAHMAVLQENRVLVGGEMPTPAELAKIWLEQYGVATFQKITLSHTKKGK